VAVPLVRRGHVGAVCTVALCVIAFAPQPARGLDARAVESFVDAAMTKSLAQTFAPGVVVTIVEGDHLILAKGYGYSNIETKAPIDPDRTLFRIASITKVITTAAALRLADQGKLDLDADVNRYLTRVKVPGNFPEPVTARRLMTHRGGFDTALLYLGFPDEKSAQQTPEEMQWDIHRVRPVTALPLYDTMGFGLLGLVIADRLGTSYRDAIQQEIFLPLGMRQSVVGLPPDRVGDAAHAHMRNDRWQAVLIPQQLASTSIQGGGDISTTAADMGKFMSALLTPGELLQPQTLTQMTNVDTFRFHPRIPGLGLTLWQYFYDGHPAAGHRGEVYGFISRMALFRDQDIGVFISVDSTNQYWPQARLSWILSHLSPPAPPAGARTLDPDHLIDHFLDRFADRFLPPPPPQPAVVPALASEPKVKDLAGVYFRRDASRLLMIKIIATLGGMPLIPLPNEQFEAAGCRPFVRKGPLYYQCTPKGGESIDLGFRIENGNRVYVGNEPVNALERQPWWLTAPFAAWPVPVFALLDLSAFLGLIGTSDPRRRGILKLTGVGAALFLLALLLELQFGYDLGHTPLHIVAVFWRLLFPLAAALLLAGAALSGPVLLRRSPERGTLPLGGASYHSMLALGSLGLVWFIVIWGLMWPFR
jgi:CubicO group peptidase (beta-lactamase class C family)